MGGFAAMKAMSERNDDPATACRPFDKDRDGFVLGEGAGALLLEELDHARSRGAKIYGEVVGCGFAGDAYHITATHPEGEGAYLAMRDALDDAGLQPQDVDYLNAHATSTPLGDVSEIRAIDRVFGDHARKLHISATKSMTGHLLGAAGAIEAIASVLALNHNLIPPTINLAHPDPAIPAHFNLTPGRAVEKPLEVVMSNTFGFGGHNAIAVFRKWREERE
jgi:3-oxoacyl-[acyl-carrier-protein] synthase II